MNRSKKTNLKLLVTGAAGFIGFNFSRYILNNTKIEVVGLDNLNNYYDVKLKKERLNILNKKFSKKKKFKFQKLDISDHIKLNKLFKKYKFDFVINLAAQAGVRYSLINPTVPSVDALSEIIISIFLYVWLINESNASFKYGIQIMLIMLH